MLNRLLPPAGSSRTLTVITLVHTVGQGLWLAISAIFARKVIGLTVGEFSTGLVVAAAVALALSTPTGHLADRIGPRIVQIWSFVLLGPITAALLLVHGVGQYIAVLSVQAVAYSASRSARMAMIAGLIPPAERVSVRAYLRSTSNVSVSLGALLAGGLLTLDTPTGYRAAVVLYAVTFTVAGLLTVLLPAVAPQPPRPGPQLQVLRDRPYLAFVVLDGLLSMHFLLLDVVLPLWVTEHTHAPRWMIAAILLINTVGVVLFQVRAARGTDEPAPAARAERFGALFLAVACTVFALSAHVPALAASMLLAAGAFVHVMGEIRQAAGSWGISFGLAPDHAQGQYQGTYAMGTDLGKMIAPAVLTWLAIRHGTAGWIAMAVGFAVIGSAMPYVVAWADRRRPVPETVVQPVGA